MAQAIRDELIEELLQGYHSPQDLLGEDGLFRELKRRLLERALGAELSEHLGYEKGDPAGRGSGNSRNGYSSKTMIGEDGAVEIAVPRDRNGSFEPQIIAKGQTRLDGFDDRIISLYARGLSVREIQGHLLELYGVEVSPDLISRVTDAVLEEVRDWQNRPLDPVYPVVNRRGTGPPIGIQSGPLYGGRDRFVPVANGRAPRASRSAFTSDAAAGGGGAWFPTGASRGGTAFQLRFLKRQLSLPVSMMSQ